jgi:hypothetical protein
MRFKESSPLLVLGMHRSGTTMLVDILERAGVFFGSQYGYNKEAFPFLSLHEQIMREYGSAWDNPFAFTEYLNSGDSECEIKKCVDSSFHQKKFSRFRKEAAQAAFWGFKDPRTCLFAEVWREIFPSARYIYIYRNPYDVALSLQKRAFDDITLSEKLGLAYRLKLMASSIVKGKTGYHLNSVLCKRLDHGVRLWQHYNEQCMNFIDTLEPENYCIVKYEDFISSRGSKECLEDFMGTKLYIEEFDFDGGAVNRYKNNVSNLSINYDCKDLAARLGYEQY